MNQRGSHIRKRKDGRWEGRYTAGHDPETSRAIYKNVLGRTPAEAKANTVMPNPLYSGTAANALMELTEPGALAGTTIRGCMTMRLW